MVWPVPQTAGSRTAARGPSLCRAGGLRRAGRSRGRGVTLGRGAGWGRVLLSLPAPELAGPGQESQEHFGSGYHCPELLVRLVEHKVFAGALAFGEGGAVLDHALQAQ